MPRPMPTPTAPFGSFTPSGEVSTNFSGARLADGSKRTSSQSAAMSSRCGMTWVTSVFMSASIEIHGFVVRSLPVDRGGFPAVDAEGVGDDAGAGLEFRFQLRLQVARVRLRGAVDVDRIGVGQVLAVEAL